VHLALIARDMERDKLAMLLLKYYTTLCQLCIFTCDSIYAIARICYCPSVCPSDGGS